MAKIYNQKVVATSQATTSQTGSTFKYKGFSSTEVKNNFKLYDMELVKRDIVNHFYIRKGEKLENPNFGTVIWDLLFENFTPDVKQLIVKDVEQIINHDPRVNVTGVTIDTTDQGIRIEAEIVYLPFNVSERMTFNFDKTNNIVM